MLWVPYPSSETLAGDACSHYPPFDSGSVTSSLYSVDPGSLKLGRKCGSLRGQTWDSTFSCLKLCRQTNGTSASLVPCNLHRCVDTQASWRGSGVVLESLSSSSGRTLAAQLTEIRFTNSSEEGLTSRLVGKDLLDCFCSDGEKHDVENSNGQADERSRNSGSEVYESEERRRLECSKKGDHSQQMKSLSWGKEHRGVELVNCARFALPGSGLVNRTSIRTPAPTACLPVSRSRVNETMLYLESIGVDCSKVINQEPRVVACNIHRVRRLVHALEYYGLKRKDLGRIINMCPKIVQLRAEKDLKPVVNFLMEEVGVSRKDVSKLVRRCPRLLVCSVDEQLRPTLLFLRTLGFSRTGGAISNNPILLVFGVEKNLVPKLKYLKSLGLSYKEAASMVIRFPAIFNYSVKENLQRKYDYLVNEIGGNLEDLMAFPQYFGYSLEKRIVPRHRLITKHNICMSLSTMLKLSEIEFMARCERSKPEQPTKVALLLEEASHVNFNGAVLKSLTMTDIRGPGIPVLIGAGRF